MQKNFLVDVVGKHWSRTVEQTAASVLQGRVCNVMEQDAASVRQLHGGILTVAHLRGFEEDLGSEVVFWFDEWSIELGHRWFSSRSRS